MTDPTPTPEDERPPLETGVPVSVDKLIRRILCDNPSMMTGPGTNTYLVGIDEIAVIDPGPDHPEHLDTIAAAGGDRIRWILCTHTHSDHSPGAAGLKERTGAEILAFADQDGLVCDRHLADGDTVEGTEFTLRAIHTPGHASNHLCFLQERERVLFAGDQVMDGSTVVINPPDGDMAEYLRTIRELRDLRPPLRRIAPAHGHMIDDPAAKLDEYLLHRAEREQQIVDTLTNLGGTADTAGLVASIYTDVPEILHPMAQRSVWAHLRKLGVEGRARSEDVDDADATWTLV